MQDNLIDDYNLSPEEREKKWLKESKKYECSLNSSGLPFAMMEQHRDRIQLRYRRKVARTTFGIIFAVLILGLIAVVVLSTMGFFVAKAPNTVDLKGDCFEIACVDKQAFVKDESIGDFSDVMGSFVIKNDKKKLY